MAYAINSDCIGCGVCESACPHAAIFQADSYPVLYVIDPLNCDDCIRCVPLCPTDAIKLDLEWAQCYGRGCPLSSKRYGGWECSVGEEHCQQCGSVLWRENTESAWICAKCRNGESGHGASCPKVRHKETLLKR